MANSAAAPITFVIPGQRQATAALRGADAAGRPLPGGLRTGRVKDSVRVGANRDAGSIRLTAVPGQDVVVLTIDGGPELTLHPDTARELLLAQAGVRANRDATAPANEVSVPSTLAWPRAEADATASRGAISDLVGGIVLKTVDVVTDLLKDKAADIGAAALAEAVDNQVTPGVYQLAADSLPRLKDSGRPTSVSTRSDGGPVLVFVHGTFSNTSGAFQNLWHENPVEVRTIFDRYKGAVYGLDHPTLGVSPIANAITLVKSLPRDAKLHLVTHSRGGLVAEALACVCGRATDDGSLSAFIQTQRDEIKELATLVKQQNVQVDRVVRVACPARGTLLASKRLDAYLSVFRWTLQLAGIPILPEVVDFLSAVAQRRGDAEKLPGLEAQVPDSPLIQWLHAGSGTIPGELRVVAGDVEGDSVFSWVKTLLSDAFYWTDNDFVVQTRSMYGGARREHGATFVLDQDGKCSHSAYFERSRAASSVVRAILEDKQPPGFRVVGPLSWKGEDSSGLRAAAAASETTSENEKPAVFVIPGLAATRLKADGQPLWPAPLTPSAVERLKYNAAAAGVEIDGLVGNTYDDLIAALSGSHQVLTFPYDWRKPLELEAGRLADALAAAIDARQATGQPVRILAHSSGCILARVVELVRPDVWKRLFDSPQSRFVMLGPPNDGFWTPMQMLTGDETFGGMLTAGAPPFGEANVRSAVGTLPGVLQLQAGLLDPTYHLESRARWQELATADMTAAARMQSWHAQKIQLDAQRWGIPTDGALKHAVDLRRQLRDQAGSTLPAVANQLFIVLGSARVTTVGFDDRGAEFAYLEAPNEGDGCVTADTALLPGIRAWMVDADHTRLIARRDAFPAYLQLLTTGETSELPRASESRRPRDASDAARRIRSRPSRAASTAQIPEAESEILSTSPRDTTAAAVPTRALRISVVNGDLTFVRQPLMLGHYRAMTLTGTERVMDRLIGKSMSRAAQVGSYPERAGDNEVFINTRVHGDDQTRIPRPEAVVVVGLGEEGKLTAAELVNTVKRGTIAWARRVAEKPGAPATFGLAATLIGSGGKGMSVAQSAQLIAEGVRSANERLAVAQWPQVSELQLIELYLDRATEAWRALQVQAVAAPQSYTIADAVATGSGGLRRPLDSSYRGADYDFISATTQVAPDGQTRFITYSLDTKRARTEITAQATQTPLLQELVNESNKVTAGSDAGRTLFNTLIPRGLEPFLGGSTEMVMELDEGTAGIPWEMLDTNTGARQESEPWAIRSKLVRKLRTQDFRRNVADASADDRVLVIGEPWCDPDKYLRLPGARREARAVADRLCCNEGLRAEFVSRLISTDDETVPGPNATAVLAALHRHPWRIVHIAGHGQPKTATSVGGVVLSPSGPDKAETFLSAIEIENLRVVPELVFVNCCHVAARDRRQLLETTSPYLHHYDRPAFAAGLAEQLINIGVRCVIVAGWAVDDTAAEAFASAFYNAIVNKSRFIDAAAEGRRAAWQFGGNTWAAYQCYGDPEWRFVTRTGDAQRPAETEWVNRFAGVASANGLRLALDTIATRARFNPDDGLKPAIDELERRFGNRWGHLGFVAEAFGKARADIGDTAGAIAWYQKALGSNDGSATLKAAEEAANLRVRAAERRISALVTDHGAAIGGHDQLADATREIELAIDQLESVKTLSETSQRHSLIGSAYKRIAMVQGASGDWEAQKAAVALSRSHYAAAVELAENEKDADPYYPALNLLVADLATNAGNPAWTGLQPSGVEAVRRYLADRKEDPNFWSVVGEIELDMYLAVEARRLADRTEGLKEDFTALNGRVSAAQMWDSVYANARFVLGLYAKRAREYAVGADDKLRAAQDREAAAAESLLDTLRRLARGVSSPAPAREIVGGS